MRFLSVACWRIGHHLLLSLLLSFPIEVDLSSIELVMSFEGEVDCVRHRLSVASVYWKEGRYQK